MLPRNPTRRARAVALAYGLATGLVGLTTALALPAGSDAVSSDDFWWIALASVVVLGSIIVRSGLWTATGAYAAVFWCFHFGLVAVLTTGLVRPLEISLWDQAWLFGPFGASAALLALVGSLGFVSGASLIHAWRPSTVVREPAPDRRASAHPHGPAGSVLVLAAIASWCAIVITTSGTAGFFGSYGEYLQTTAEFGPSLALMWLCLGCGIVMAVTGQGGWLRSIALMAFGCFALVALPLGLRGEVMFPSIAALVAVARCGRPLAMWKGCAFVVALLVLIPVVREVRNTGLQGLAEVALEPRLFDAFVEMGGSLHPVEKVVRWRAEGEPLEKGASYWAPIERAAARILPGMRSTAAEDDMRIMNVLVTDRVGAIGFSPVAEAYRNFGGIGVSLVLALVGACMAALDRIGQRRTAVLVLAAVYVPLLINIRNSFVSLPAQCAVGVVIIVMLGAIRHMLGSVVSKPYARSTYLRSEI